MLEMLIHQKTYWQSYMHPSNNRALKAYETNKDLSFKREIEKSMIIAPRACAPRSLRSEKPSSLNEE